MINNRTFKILAENLVNVNDWDYYNLGVTANPGSGFIPLLNFAQKEWIGERYLEGNASENCFNIHYELQWDVRHGSVTLYLHYETNPYKTQNELKKLDSDFVNGYKKARDELYSFLLKNNPEEWIIDKTSLRLAYYEFGKEATVGEARDKVASLVHEMTPLVSGYLRS